MKFPFRKKKKKAEEPEKIISKDIKMARERPLPEELAKFRLRGPFEETLTAKPPGKAPEREVGGPLMPGPPAPPPFRPLPGARPGPRAEPRPAPRGEADKLELILGKLDIIEARLRVIEEKLKRF